ncbi:MAG: flagellar export chaperone FlgN [Candidatus Gastranaerophilales bacterium]|nr:flagellar export chaperone FlgN [Candidatus Gastranaerophilales bacterium]
MKKVIELNQIIDNEIQICKEFDEILEAKKEAIMKSKVTELAQFDAKIVEYHKKLKEISVTRKLVNKKFGNENLYLSQIISLIEDKSEATKIKEKRNVIRNITQKIELNNKIINSLIDHSLKIIDGSILAIAMALSNGDLQSKVYGQKGEKIQNNDIKSSIVEEA